MPRVINGATSLTSQYFEKPAWKCRIQSTGSTDFTSGVAITNYLTTNTLHFVAGGCVLNSGIITVPVGGLYYVGCTVRYDSMGGAYFYVDIQHNNTTQNRFLQADAHTYNHGNVHIVARAAAGDQFQLVAVANGDTTVAINDDSYFTGHLIDG
tara:strand:- start:1031 stop:1489 length:459 start_codon:yes stop_codon:yes gene_type:complete